MTDAELLHYATEFREGILDGQESTRYCFMVCAALEGALCFENGDDAYCRLINGNIEGWDHCWLELKDGRILDPTADQFPNLFPDAQGKPMPDVYLGPRPTWYDLADIKTLLKR